MPVPNTPEELLDLVRKSGLVEPERLDAFQAQAANDPGPATARRWAGLLVGLGLVTNFQAEQFLLGKWRGFTLGKYRVLERLGFGGTGTVYLCEHVRVRRKVAVKVLPSTKSQNPAALGRFYREARAAGVLDHPNLVRCHDIDEEGGLHFLIMDYVDGANLQEIVGRTGPLAPARAAHYIRQAALGLQHAHEAGLVHRDIKPANILVDRAGVVRVLDLGLARFFTDDNDLLTLKYDDKNVLGTADYVAPEQALNSHEVDVRADVYSLGCTFYFLLTGQPTFPTGRAAQKLIAHQVKQPTPIQQLRPEAPADMVAVANKMMAKDRRDRYQTPAEVATALEAWARVPVPPPTEEELPRLSPAAARNVSSVEFDLGPTTPTGLVRTPPPLRRPRIAPAADVGERAAPLLVQNPPAPIAVSMAQFATPRAISSRTVSETRGALAAQTPTELVPNPATVPTTAVAPAATKPMSRARRRVLSLVVLLAVSATLGASLRLGLGRLTTAARTPEQATVHRVSRSLPGAFTSIREAVGHAQPGEHVQIVDASWEEAVQLSGADDGGRDVVLEGAEGKPVVWRVPHDHQEGEPLLALSGIAGLRLQNVILDGQDRVKDLVTLSGSCPSLTLADVQLKGFRRAAVALMSCAGEADRPVTLERLRALPARAAEAALRFEARPEEPIRHVHVRDCRLEGPYQAAVSFRGPALGVELITNRIFNSAYGLFYRRTAPLAPLGLTLASNTFCAIEGVGVRFETTPPIEDSRVVFTSNLFARTGTVARVDDFFPQPATTGAQWIGFDEMRPAAEAPAAPRAFRKTFHIDGPSVSSARLSLTADAAYTVWINGERVGHGEFLPHLRRVQAFDVARYLRAGANVVAIQGTGQPGAAGVLAQLTYACPGAPPVTLISDASWKATHTLPEGWQAPDFDDRLWPAAKVAAPYGKGPAAWQNLVWDAVVQDSYPFDLAELFPDPSGNARDWTSQESFPLLKAVALNFSLPTDPADDARFLRYGRASLLAIAGNPGVPPAEKKP